MMPSIFRPDWRNSAGPMSWTANCVRRISTPRCLSVTFFGNHGRFCPGSETSGKSETSRFESKPLGHEGIGEGGLAGSGIDEEGQRLRVFHLQLHQRDTENRLVDELVDARRFNAIGRDRLGKSKKSPPSHANRGGNNERNEG